MFPRFVALAFFLIFGGVAGAQVALTRAGSQVLKPSQSAEAAPDSAWLDLRQNSASNSKIQAAPSWVESITFSAPNTTAEGPKKSVFRIRLTRPNDECQL